MNLISTDSNSITYVVNPTEALLVVKWIQAN